MIYGARRSLQFPIWPRFADRREGFATTSNCSKNAKSQIHRKTGVVKMTLAKIRPRKSRGLPTGTRNLKQKQAPKEPASIWRSW